MTTQLNAATVQQASALISKLSLLLAWDLAAIKGETIGGYTVQMVMDIGGNGFKPQLYINSKDLSDWITNQITETIGQLSALDINIDSMLQQYRKAGETLLQGIKNPIDMPQEF